MSDERFQERSHRRSLKNVAWTVLLVSGLVLLIHCDVLRRHNTLVFLLVLATVLWLWLRPWITARVQDLLTIGLHWLPGSLTRKATAPGDLAGISADLVAGVQLTFILSLSALVFPQLVFLHGSPVGEHLEQAGYSVLRVVLSAAGKEDPRVIVIDTSDVPRVRAPGLENVALPVRGASTLGFMASPFGQGTWLAASALVPGKADNNARNWVTERMPLKSFLESMGDPKHARWRPRAVGIDINFHNDRGHFLLPDDYRFFEFCLDQEEKSRERLADGTREGSGERATEPLKIYLGLSKAEGLPPEQWLGMPEYAALGASMAVFRSDAGHVLAEVTTPEGKGPPPLGAALAQLTRGEGAEGWPKPVWPLTMVTTIFTEKEIPIRGATPWQAKTFLVDYSWLKALEKETKPLDAYGDPAEFRALAGKIVLLGDVEKAPISDAFIVPGEAEPVPGVYLHACAAATLARAPLYELRPFVSESADIILALGILIWVLGLRLYAKSPEAMLLPASGLVAVAVVATALLLVSVRVFWPDALVVALVLAIHPLVEWAWHALSHAVVECSRFLKQTPKAKGDLQHEVPAVP